MVEILNYDDSSKDLNEIRRAADALKSGKLVVYPTETVYGLAADATSDDGVSNVFEAKSRSRENPISVAVNSLSMAYRVGKLTEKQVDLIQNLLPGPLTVLVNRRPLVSKLLSAGTEKIGLRMPDHSVPLKLVEVLGGPITCTSANISGNPPPGDLDQALDQLGEHIELAIDGGKSLGSKPSTVVDVEEDVEVIRRGPISESTIRSVLE